MPQTALMKFQALDLSHLPGRHPSLDRTAILADRNDWYKVSSPRVGVFELRSAAFLRNLNHSRKLWLGRAREPGHPPPRSLLGFQQLDSFFRFSGGASGIRRRTHGPHHPLVQPWKPQSVKQLRQIGAAP